MFDRIMSALLFTGALVLATALFQRHYAAPFCGADAVTSAVMAQVSAQVSPSGLDVARIKDTAGGLFSRARQCSMDVAPIIDLQRLRAAHWMHVLYSDARESKTDAVRVEAHVAGPAELTFSGGSGG
jgi:hypothetical protein